MRITVTGKNITVSDALYARVEKKLGKLNRYFGDDVEAQVRLTVSKQRNICEVTIPIPGGGILRAEDSADNNMFAAIDEVGEKLERQVRRHRTRLEKQLKTTVEPLAAVMPDEFAEEEEDFAIVREKRFTVVPMTPDEAIEQMELLGHTFFLFLNTQTGGVCAVYRRKENDYGLLIPEK